MAKKLQKKVPATVVEEPLIESSDTSDSAGKEPESPTPAVCDLPSNACPRCKHVSGDKAIRFGSPSRSRCNIVIDGIQYGTVEAQRIMCENCKQIHTVRKYL